MHSIAEHSIAMVSALPSISPFLLSLLLCLCSSNAHGGGGQSHHTARVDTLMPGTVCSTPKGSNPNSLKIAHRHGPCSPIEGWKNPSQLEILHWDQIRTASLQQRLSKASQGAQVQESDATLSTKRGDAFSTANYVVTIGIGTPKKDQTVAIDTGSNVCWIQCEPCSSSCYQQNEPKFNPSESSSYQKVSCNSSECSQTDDSYCSDGTCGYQVLYGDSSTTNGSLSKDTLTLTPADVFSNFVFGCGQQNQGLFGGIAGLFGLGRAAVSLVTQTSQKFGQVFSYCLPPSANSMGQLTFGKSTSNAISYTPMLTDPRIPSLYFIGLTGISVEGQFLSIPPTVFSSPGTIIDSGTIITRLPPSAYQSLRSAFRSGMSNYSMAPPYSLFDTCYDLSGREDITVPSVALHFDGGVDMDLDISGIVIGVNTSQFCLAFAGNENAGDVGIIGNVQQHTFEVTYDLGMERIGFASGACN